jgi:hypothetical protein
MKFNSIAPIADPEAAAEPDLTWDSFQGRIMMTSSFSIGYESSRSDLDDQAFAAPAPLGLVDADDEIAASADILPLEAEDAGVFLAAAEQAQAKAWFYYFPRLYFYGQSKRHLLRWERHAGSILLYQIRQQKSGSRMDLYLPPFPFDSGALRHAVQRMRDFNGDRSGRIVFVQETDILRVAREGFEVFLKSEEFIFDRAAVMALEGAGFRSLRQELSRALRQGQVETRPYTRADQSACLALTEAWKARLTTNGMKATPYRYTLACLAAADLFPPSLLSGLVVEVDGEVRGFAFSGPITSTMGCNFLCVTDPGFRGMPHLLRYRLMAGFPDLLYFNDSTDSDRPGLRELKQRFRPVEMHNLGSARQL